MKLIMWTELKKKLDEYFFDENVCGSYIYQEIHNGVADNFIKIDLKDRTAFINELAHYLTNDCWETWELEIANRAFEILYRRAIGKSYFGQASIENAKAVIWKQAEEELLKEVAK